MNRDKLYDAAFRYKKAGLWKILWDNEIFAVKLGNNEIGYISIMGQLGEYNALGLYIGDEGFGSYRLLSYPERPNGNLLRNHEIYLKQNCLQLALESKDNLLPEEVDEVRAYAKKNHIRLSGKNAFPQFIKYEPDYHPWKVKKEEDMEALYTAMSAAILLAEMLKKNEQETFGIYPLMVETNKVPLFEVKGDTLLHLGSTPLPGDLKENYEYAIAENEIALASVKKLPRKGIWESELIRVMDPVQNNPEDAPYYPLFLVIVESKNGNMLPVPVIEKAERDSDGLLLAFADAWKTQKTYPKEIRCRDERTYALLKDFCEKTNVKISIYNKKMRALDEAEKAFIEYSLGADDEDENDDQMDEVIDLIMSMNKDEIRMMPQAIVDMIRAMIEEEIFPKDIADKLTRKLKDL